MHHLTPYSMHLVRHIDILQVDDFLLVALNWYNAVKMDLQRDVIRKLSFVFWNS